MPSPLPVPDTARPRATLTRREWLLVAAGGLAWILLLWGGVWLFHQLTRRPEGCASAAEASTHQVKAASGGPRNAVQLLTGQGRCP
jgi:hypothetical protein